MIMRTATTNDLQELAALEQLCNLSPWSISQLTDAIKLPAPIWVIEENQHIVAMLVWQLLVDQAEIHLLNTHPHYRQQGYARQLLKHLSQHALQQNLTRILLEVRASNITAQQLYKHIGFTECGQRKNYYSNGEDALLMEKLC